MAKRFTDTEKYKKRFFRGLPGPYKLLWDYLYHDCNAAGIWYVDFEIAQIYIGADMPVNAKDALRIFNAEAEKIVVLEGGKKWFIPSFIGFQYGVLSPDCKPHRHVLDLLAKNDLKGYRKGLDTLEDKEKDKDKDVVVNSVVSSVKEKKCIHISKKFIKPTIDEIRAYCKERGNKVDPEKFFAHYEASGWKRGNTKISNWHMCVHTWERNDVDREVKYPPEADVIVREYCGIRKWGVPAIKQAAFYGPAVEILKLSGGDLEKARLATKQITKACLTQMNCEWGLQAVANKYLEWEAA